MSPVSSAAFRPLPTTVVEGGPARPSKAVAPVAAGRPPGPNLARTLPGRGGIGATVRDRHGFYKIADRLFVGNRPTEARMCELARLGVRNVVSLEDRFSALPRTHRREHCWGHKYGMRVHVMPVSPVFPLRFSTIAEIIRFMTEVNNQPIYVHCLFGRERALLLAGLIRIYYDGWAPEVAYAEMREQGYRPWLVPVMTMQFHHWGHSPKVRAALQPSVARPSRGDLPARVREPVGTGLAPTPARRPAEATGAAESAEGIEARPAGAALVRLRR
jgi:hypothetical protein